MANPEISNIDVQSLVIENWAAPPVTMKILRNQGILKAGTVLGVVSATGFLKALDSKSTDGSENPAYILLNEITTPSDAEVEVRLGLLAAGKVNAAKLVFENDDYDSIDDFHTALKSAGIIAVSLGVLGGIDNQ